MYLYFLFVVLSRWNNTHTNYFTPRSALWSIYISINFWVPTWCIAALWEVISLAFAIKIYKRPCNYLVYHQTTRTHINFVTCLYFKKIKPTSLLFNFPWGICQKSRNTYWKSWPKSQFSRKLPNKIKKKAYTTWPLSVSETAGVERKCQLKQTTTCVALSGIIRTTGPASILMMTRKFFSLKYS